MAAKREIRWAYGVTTVPSRKDGLLPRTLASLAAAGFNRPRLFVDGAVGGYESLGLEVTYRNPTVRTFGNFILGLAELLIRTPLADRYAIFQDDVVAVRNLRQYLERLPYPGQSYLNLYTFPENQALCPRDYTGFYPSNQRGLGALALVFDREAALTLLTHRYTVSRPFSSGRWWLSVDGGVVSALKKAGHREHVHNPSLVQHTGQNDPGDPRSHKSNRPGNPLSTLGGTLHPLSPSFPGEGFDALGLLRSGTAV